MKCHSTPLLSATAAIGLLFGAQAAALTIVYDFTDGSPSATTNEFEDAGVTAGDVVTDTPGVVAGPSDVYERLQRNLRDSQEVTFTITIEIGSTPISLTEMSFIDGIHTREGTNDTFSQWDLGVSTGSLTPDIVTNSVTSGVNPDFTSKSNTIALEGLTNLSDTEVTFTFVVNYGVSPDFSAQGNNVNRNAFIDDLTFTGTLGPVERFALRISPNEADFDFEWDSQDGKVYDLLSSLDLGTPVAEWPVYEVGEMVYEGIPAAGSITTLTAVPSTDPHRFFAMRETAAPPPPPLLDVDFEEDDGGFTASADEGTAWE